jgi:hypothetical protein
VLRRSLALVPTILLTACAALVPSTAARLATFDPLTTDPAAIELVVILPPGLAINPGSAKLDLTATRGRERLAGSFRLKDRPADEGFEVPKGATARQFAIADTDLERMRALQAKIADWKREGEANGSLAVGLGGCAVGVGPAPDATGSVLIRVRTDSPYLPLIRDGKLADLLGPELLGAIKPCHGAE